MTAILLLLLLLLAAFFSSIFLVGWFLSTSPYKGPRTDHFNGKTFTNPDGQRAKGFGDVMQWMMKRDRPNWQPKPLTDQIALPPENATENCRITFVNHSTFLIQAGGINILTDPVWSERVSPVSFAGPQRFHPPGIRFEDLPPIHLVLLSHNHYDHMDLPTLRNLHNRFQPVMVAPLGNQAFLEKQGFRIPKELDWWDGFEALPQCNITATPASHFSGRGFFDRDKSLWCGYFIEVGGKRIYFVGDSGYGSFFPAITEYLGRVDVAIIPIGSFKPNWFMKPIHMGPKEAVQVWKDLGQPEALACHFGSFSLGDDQQTEPEDLLRELMAKESGTFEALQPGAHRAY